MNHFEPGSIICCLCGYKDEDPWNTHPEGFFRADSCPEVYCEYCWPDFSRDHNVKGRRLTSEIKWKEKDAE